MTINKYSGKTKEEAINAAKQDLGPAAVIMNVREVRPGGLFGIFKKSTYEVTAAIEDDYQSSDKSVKTPPYKVDTKKSEDGTSNFSAVADEKIDLSAAPVGNSAISHYKKKNATQIKTKPMEEKSEIDADQLKSAFEAVSRVIEEPASSESEPEKETNEEHKKEEPEKEFVPLTPRQARTSEEETEKKHEEETAKVVRTEDNASDTGFTSRGAESYLGFVRMLYNKLIDHEVDERYVNQALSDLDGMIEAGNSMDYLLTNVYQKMVLKIGVPHQIEIKSEGAPSVVFLVGPTGVGKTTTLAKMASNFKVAMNKKVAFLTADTFRIAAAAQLSTYADILDVKITVLMSPEDIVAALNENKDNDVIFVDTVGFSHNNQEQQKNLSKLLSLVPAKYNKQVYLVLSATTKYNDLKHIVKTYNEITDFSIIFTKLDETENFGNIYNIRQFSGKNLSYITNGQKVPEDIAVLDPQKLVKNLLGGE
ncbi:MAG: flagellar biosynthesis protein FlhF [Lachnospiraceae bacterium]|nr:MAG: flagellar biosynthesis protein FlhF [Lachnospiraceae bacterium]